MCARTAMGGKLDRAIGDSQPQRGADRAFDKANFAAMGAIVPGSSISLLERNGGKPDSWGLPNWSIIYLGVASCW